ncbi:hypothetical protein LJR034_003922 [Caballeronia sp. LjRoot34]|uniref:hypothetical protein n=1 Tax=Caballeronia sp. LjRoot34 TaxID=3342325 RepID=UPI003ED111C5
MLNSTLGRLFGGIFASTSTGARAQAQQPTSPPPAKAQPAVVGQGGANERHVTIDGMPVLFRDEGDVVVQFTPAFEYALQETTCGMKLIPSLTPHWEMCEEHCCSMTQAVVNAIQAGGQQPRQADIAKESGPHFSEKPAIVRSSSVSQPAVPESPARFKEPREQHRHEGATYGRIVEWGEKTFPDRKRPGKTYDSFALTLQTRTSRRDLQGEGLKDAIAEVSASIGDQVEVRRLGKIKVPAVDELGHPKLDGTGRQILWDKWEWSIKKKS